MAREFVDVKQAAAIAGVCADTIRRLVDRGVIYGEKVGFGVTAPLMVRRSDLTPVKKVYAKRPSRRRMSRNGKK